MIPFLPPMRLTGALALRDGRLERRSVALADGRFTAGPLPAVDLTGYLLLPGIVDLQAALPVPAPADEDAVALLDSQAACHGVTTRWVSVPWSWEGPALGPAAAAASLAAIGRYRARSLTDLRPAVAAEALMTEATEALIELVRASDVGLVVFTNRGEALRDLNRHNPAGVTARALAAGLTPAAYGAELDQALQRSRAVPRHLCRLAEAFDDLGVAYGSAGDPTAETREHHSMIGARLCLDPGTARVAGAAHAVGDPVLAEAGGLLAGDPTPLAPRLIALVQAGLCDGLVSGRDSAAPFHAAFRLADLGVMPLEKAWRLVSEIPARILRLPDRGVIAPGKRADLVVVDIATRRIEATIAGGRLGYLAGDAGRRFIAAGSPEPLAAE